LITNQIDKQSYQGNGSNTNFAIPFTVVVNDIVEVGVILRDITIPTAPVDTPQTYNVQFTMSGGNHTGNPFNTTIVMVTPPTANQIVVIYRLMPLTQLLNMVTNGFDYSNLNVVHDRIVAMLQVINEITSRAPVLAQATQNNPNPVPEPPGNAVLGFNLGQWVWYSITSVTNAIATLTGDVTSSGGVNAATTIAAGAVSLTKMANLAANSIIGNNTGSPATPIALTLAQATAMLNLATAALKGLIPAWPNDVTKFFRGDGTYALAPSAYNYNAYWPGSTSNYWSTSN
jgi:hypothetical protein